MSPMRSPSDTVKETSWKRGAAPKAFEMLRTLISGGNDVGSPEFSSLEIIRKHDSRGARFAADWEPHAFAFAGQPRRLSLHELYYQAGLPSLKRRVRVSPPFTTSRASVSSAPSCLILEP